MPAPLLRKKPSSKPETFDPVSTTAWAAGAKATAAVIGLVDLLALNPKHKQVANDLTAQLEAAVALTPCAVKSDARTKLLKRWSFQDYLLTVRVCEALRDIVVDGVQCVPPGAFGLFDATREEAAQTVVTFIEQIEAYEKLVKRERAYERLSGEKSLRRGLL